VDDIVQTPVSMGDFSSFSVSFWFRPDLFDGREGMFSSAGMYVYAAWDALSVALINSQKTYFCRLSGVEPALGEWHFVTVSYDGDTCALYYNDTYETKDVSDNERLRGGNFHVGRGNGSYGDSWFEGMMDEVRVYNRALTQAEIEAVRDNSTPSPVTSTACADSLDNDADGLSDYPDDPGCTSANDTDEYNAPTVDVPTATLTVSPTTIDSGDTTTITWDSTDADTCTGTNFETGDATSGELSVSSEDDTTYTLACTNTAGTATDSATVSFTRTTDTQTRTEEAQEEAEVASRTSGGSSSNARNKDSAAAGAQTTSTTATRCSGTGDLVFIVNLLITLGYIPADKAEKACVTLNTIDATSVASENDRLQLSRTLVQGMRGADVKQLQQALNSRGYFVASAGKDGSPGRETTYFGSRTTQALQRFQCAELNVCSGSPRTTGYGQVGPKTREALAQ